MPSATKRSGKGAGSAKTDPNKRLIRACLMGKMADVVECIEAGADPWRAVPWPAQELDYPGEAATVRLTPLRAAVRKGRFEVARALIERYGAPTGERLYNLTLLHDAVISLSPDLVRYLVDEHGLDPNARGYKEHGVGAGGIVPLQLAMRSDGSKAEAMVALLVELGANPDLSVHGGKLTALGFARKHRRRRIAALLERLSASP